MAITLRTTAGSWRVRLTRNGKENAELRQASGVVPQVPLVERQRRLAIQLVEDVPRARVTRRWGPKGSQPVAEPWPTTRRFP